MADVQKREIRKPDGQNRHPLPGQVSAAVQRESFDMRTVLPQDGHQMVRDREVFDNKLPHVGIKVEHRCEFIIIDARRRRPLRGSSSVLKAVPGGQIRVNVISPVSAHDPKRNQLSPVVGLQKTADDQLENFWSQIVDVLWLPIRWCRSAAIRLFVFKTRHVNQAVVRKTKTRLFYEPLVAVDLLATDSPRVLRDVHVIC